MKRAVLAIILASAACAPASAHRAPGAPPAVHWPAAIKANVGQTETNLERDSGLNWEPLNKDALGRTVFGTVGASSAQADEAHAWLCGTEWGRDAVRMWASGGGKGCFTQPTGPVASTPSGGGVVTSVTGNVTWFTDSTVAFPKVRTDGRGCAHLTWPAGTRVRVTWGGKSITCIIHDRGPARWTGNVLDLRQPQFRELGPISTGKLRGALIERLAP